MSFQYDPLELSILMMKLHFEKKYNANENYTKTLRYAVSEFMQTVTRDEMEEILQSYVEGDKVEFITFASDDESWRIEEYVKKTERFKKLIFFYEKRGYSGLGVVDVQNETFNPCEFGGHWSKIGEIMRSSYGDYGVAFEKILLHGLSEHKGITTDFLDKFILENFILVGGQYSIETHLRTSKEKTGKV